MLSCYLDDSDNDQGPVLSLAGYFGKPDDFKQFEIECNELFAEYGISVFHSMKFHHGKGDFKGWGALEKREFVERLRQIVYSCNMSGICSSVNKEYFKNNLKKNLDRELSSMSPLGYAFAKIVYAIPQKLSSYSNWPISFIVESGNSNDGNIEKYFSYAKREFPAPSGIFDTISFVGKNECRAVQLADFLAFYGRKNAELWEKGEYRYASFEDDYLSIMMKNNDVLHHFERSYLKVHDEVIGPGLILPGFTLLPKNGGL